MSIPGLMSTSSAVVVCDAMFVIASLLCSFTNITMLSVVSVGFAISPLMMWLPRSVIFPSIWLIITYSVKSRLFHEVALEAVHDLCK